MAPKAFEDALTKLVNDERYRSAITANPKQLKTDFDLDDDELGVLRDAWQKTTMAGDVEAHTLPYPLSLCCSCSC